jgi:hypothetical protein
MAQRQWITCAACQQQGSGVLVKAGSLEPLEKLCVHPAGHCYAGLDVILLLLEPMFGVIARCCELLATPLKHLPLLTLLH